MNLHESSKERVYIKWNKNTHSILVNIDPYLLDDTSIVKFKNLRFEKRILTMKYATISRKTETSSPS